MTAWEIVDPYTIRMKTDGPAATLPYDFVRLFIVSAKAAKDARNEQFNSGKAAVGTGPYKFVSWTPKGDLVLERYDDYWRGKSHWQRVVRKEITNDAASIPIVFLLFAATITTNGSDLLVDYDGTDGNMRFTV